MKRIFTLIATLFIVTTSLAQIGGGWDWAYNTGSLLQDIKHFGYDGSGNMLIVGKTFGDTYLGDSSNKVVVPHYFSVTNPGYIHFLGKILPNGSASFIRTFNHPYLNFGASAIDAAGNFYVSIQYSDFGAGPIDIGNGFSLTGMNKVAMVKFSPVGATLWVKIFDLGVNTPTTPFSAVSIDKVSVSNTGNIFFTASANNASTAPTRFSVYKLDASGNTLWTKYSSAAFNIYNEFVDTNENLYLTINNAPALQFNGETITPNFGNCIISLDGNGNNRWIKSSAGIFNDFVIDKFTNNCYFNYTGFTPNAGFLSELTTIYFNEITNAYFAGIIKIDAAGNVLLVKKASDGVGGAMTPLANNRLLFTTSRIANVAPASFGTDVLIPMDATFSRLILVEADASLNPVKFIAGCRSYYVAPLYNAAAYGDTYGVVSRFGTSLFAIPNNATTFPFCTYGSKTLTGFNAGNFTQYTAYSNIQKFDYSFAQCKSANFPTISTTTWLGINANWNDAANWTNGVPTASVKAVFNAGAANYPSTFTSPTSGTLEVNSGVNVTLPSTLTIAGAIKNEGTIKINNVGFFQGLGATEWKGNGTVEFLGSALTYFFMAKPFTNGIVLNSSFNTFYDMNISGVTFNTTSGKFDMGNKIVSITNPSSTSIVGANATNYFTNGTLQRAITSNGTYEFPVGSSTSFQSATVSANNLLGVTSLSAKFTAGAITGTAPNTALNGVPVTSALNAGWYSITPNAQPTSGTYNVSLNLRASTNSVADAARYTVIKRDNSATAWAVQGTYNLATVNGTTVTATVNNLTSFSDFAIGMGTTVLPVNFTSFTAKANGSTSQLNWITATEVNNKGFNVQHSVDGINYNNLSFVNGNGNSIQNNSYAFTHASPINGNNYYRLQQVDNNGKSVYSPVQVVNFNNLVTTLNVYPNPVISTINFNKNFTVGTNLQIINSVGQVVENSVFGGNRYQPKAQLKGSYQVVITEGGNKRFIANILFQ